PEAAPQRVAELDFAAFDIDLQEPHERLSLRGRIVSLELQLRQAQLVTVREHLVDPVPLRVDLDPVARVGADERAPPRELLDAEAKLGRALEHVVELVVVEREPDVVDPRQPPLARLDDDVDRAALELAQAVAEALA